MNHTASISNGAAKNIKRRWFSVVLLTMGYILLKCLINSEAVVAINPGVHLGWFNFASPAMKESVTYRWKVDPIILLSPYKTSLSPEHPLKPLSRSAGEGSLHILGTDHLGRDVLAGWVNGLEIALLVGIGAALLSGILSLVFGAFGSYFEKFPKRIARTTGILLFVLFSVFVLTVSWFLLGIISGLTCAILSVLYLFAGLTGIHFIKPGRNSGLQLPAGVFNRRVLEAVQPIPELVLLLLFTVLFPRMNFIGLILLLTILRIPYGSWYLQGLGRQFINAKFIEQSRTMGFSSGRIVLMHLAPLMIPGTVVFTMLTASRMIGAESVLSFFGIGPTGDMVTWGNMIRLGLTDLSMWWVSIFPIMGLVVLSYFFSALLKD